MATRSTPAITALDRAGVTYTLHEYTVGQHAGSFGEAVAAALGIEPGRMFKTLVAEVSGALHVAVVPVAAQLNLKALAAAAGGKRARMAPREAAERATGFVTGGIAPLGHRQRLPITVDVSAREFTTMYCSAGRKGLSIELAPDDLLRVAGADTAAISA